MLLFISLQACLPNYPLDNAEKYHENQGHDFDGDGQTEVDGDCDDQDATVFKGATEYCNEKDNDCDGLIDDDSEDAVDWYLDADGDGFGRINFEIRECEAPVGYIALKKDGNGETIYDCNDEDRFIFPDAAEFCDSKDNDCDDLVDDDDPNAVGVAFWYRDADRDGFGTPEEKQQACMQPAGFIQGEEDLPAEKQDCDDGDPNVNPGMNEICDQIDNDCDGGIDNEDPDDTPDWMWTEDADGDGYGAAAQEADRVASCEPIEGYARSNDDCDDTDIEINPQGTEICDGVDQDCDGLIDEGTQISWYADMDGDGYGSNPLDITSIQDCDNANPTGYVLNYDDCDDNPSTGANNYPGAPEYCDGVDNNCDTVVDENNAVDAEVWFIDSDSDGFGDEAGTPFTSCSQPVGYVADNSDCDDYRSFVNPNAAEDCFLGSDENCDGSDNDSGALNCSNFYVDADSDGFGDGNDSQCLCYAEGDYIATSATDCDDSKPLVNPNAQENCATGHDDDCDGDSNDHYASNCSFFFFDEDLDGFGTEDGICMCEPEGIYSAVVDTDCNDVDTLVNPDASEICDEFDVDEDCSGEADDEFADGAIPWYQDLDLDDYGNADVEVIQCDQPAGFVLDNTDCDDLDPIRNPRETEICLVDPVTLLHRDEDCSGSDNDPILGTGAGGTVYYLDEDQDTYGVTLDSRYLCYTEGFYTTILTDDCDDGDLGISPGDVETCATADDEDCDGLEDEDGALGCSEFYYDEDNDGYGLGSDSQCLCNAEGNYRASLGGDCDDSDQWTNPGFENCGLVGIIPETDSFLSFTGRQEDDSGSETQFLGNFDYNNDGISDIAVIDYGYDAVIGQNQYTDTGALFLYLGPVNSSKDLSTGAGADLIFASENASEEVGKYGLSAGNWDTDFETEIMVNGSSDAYIIESALAGMGLITDTNPAIISMSNIMFSTQAYLLGDFNRDDIEDPPSDSLMDIVLGGSVYLGTESSQGQGIDGFAFGAGYSYNTSISLQNRGVDFDGDGTIERLSIHDVDIRITSFDPNILWTDHYVLSASHAVTGRVEAGDLNGDGYPELISSNIGYDHYDAVQGILTDSGGVWVFEGSSSGITATGLGDAYWSYVGGAGEQVGNQLAVMDVDNDGNGDLVFAQASSAPSVLFYGNLVAPSSGDPATILEADAVFSGTAYGVGNAGDQNLDGYDDILLRAETGNDIYLFLGASR